MPENDIINDYLIFFTLNGTTHEPQKISARNITQAIQILKKLYAGKQCIVSFARRITKETTHAE